MQGTDFNSNSVLMKKYKEGDREVLGELCSINFGLVSGIARRFCSASYEFEDLFEVGKIGLLKAIEGFDESLGYSFSTYAFPLILGEIKRFLRDDGPVKISRAIKTNARRVHAARECFYRENKREAHLSELSQITGLSPSEITEALDSSNPVASLEEHISGNENSLRLSDTIAGDDEFESLTDSIALMQAIQKLEDKERRLISLRFFKNMTQTQVARLLGISQVTVSRLEKRIIDKLRQDFL